VFIGVVFSPSACVISGAYIALFHVDGMQASGVAHDTRLSCAQQDQRVPVNDQGGQRNA